MMRFWTIVFLIATLCFALGGCLLCIGSQVTLAWNRSTEPIVAGYNVYYGGKSGAYTNEVSAGADTNITINGLVDGSIYYFAATAYSAAGVESPFSAEVVYRMPLYTPPKTNHVIQVTARLVQITTATNLAGPWLVSTNFRLQPSAFSIATLTNPPAPMCFWTGVVVLDITQTNF
jgi:hypothetical protein